MAEPFKLALVGKFSFGRRPMDVIRKFFISLSLKGNYHTSLLDNRHILIKLEIEEDYSRIWVRQGLYVNGRGMRIFKWSTKFLCLVESPIVPIWVSFLYLPVRFVHCKPALFSIASVVGTPLRVAHATASVNRPSVARVLVELRKHQAQDTDTMDNGKQHTPVTNVQLKVAPSAQYIIVGDNRPEKPNSSDPAQQHTNKIDLDEQYRPNAIGTDTPAGHNTVQGPIDHTNNIQVDSHGSDILEADMVKNSGRHSLSRSDMDCSSGQSGEDEGRKAFAVRRLRKLIRMHRLSLVCILEPFLGADRLDPTRIRLGIEKAFSSMSGKIWIFWSSHFSIKVSHFFFPEPVLISYVYASCSTSGREALWDALIEFANTHNNPWMVVGDFNIVKSLSEISGGHTQPHVALDAFNLALLDCGLEDTGFVGSLFTWTTGRTRKRLDRVVCNSLWSRLFSVFRISHLNRIALDHSPLLLSYDRNTARGPSKFKFLHTWLKHPNCLDIIRQSWSAPVLGRGMRAFQQKLIRLKLCLKACNKDVFGNVFQRVKESEEELTQNERQYNLSGLPEDREGDANTRFFHAMIQKKHQLFHVHRIQDASLVWLSESSTIADSAITFFQGLLTDGNSQFQPEDFSFIHSLITEEDDVDLCRIPDVEESCWDIVEADLHAAVLDCFSGSAMPRGFQSSLLILLPKKDSPSTWADFRLISLCNVSNKVLTKLLVLQLFDLLPRIISPSHSGFVPGWVLHDNVLLVQELVHDINRRTRRGNVVLKLDMAKAYDRMSWSFILQMLQCFGFYDW
ncbi:hypothetical protein WN944_018300 [Citrus x changshan-huyou]|uniref:Reverse transcriptase domain-containing protein n=1 Tax=Citrus x changshan-huyou TaxID=2935761 RepID=A0AAP0LUH5_9ROSI